VVFTVFCVLDCFFSSEPNSKPTVGFLLKMSKMIFLRFRLLLFLIKVHLMVWHVISFLFSTGNFTDFSGSLFDV